VNPHHAWPTIRIARILPVDSSESEHPVDQNRPCCTATPDGSHWVTAFTVVTAPTSVTAVAARITITLFALTRPRASGTTELADIGDVVVGFRIEALQAEE
jgi:hypothetical protein